MIPKVIHLCFGMTPDFGGKPWSLVHYACVRSMAERLRPDAIRLYCAYEPSGPWWELTRSLVSVIRIDPPTEIFGNPLIHPAHRADVVRLDALIEDGGIYLDCDVLAVRDFDALLKHRCVLGLQGEAPREGLCNGVILAEKNASFLRRWRETYRTFRSRGRDDFWSEHSVAMPLKLAREDSSDLTVLGNRAFHWPLFHEEHLRWTFASTRPIDEAQAFAHHLWESIAWHDYLAGLTVRKVRERDTNFHRWLRPLLAELPDDFAPERIWHAASRVTRRAAIHADRVVYRWRRAARRAAGDTLQFLAIAGR
jgi:hypothetical protein